MSKHLLGGLMVLVLALSTSACGRKAEKLAGALEARPLSLERQVSADAASPERLLSYKHQIEVQVPSGQLEQGLKALSESCRGVAEHGCIVLRSSQTRGLRAEIVMSVRRPAVESLRGQASGLGTLSSQSTQAEDLSGPITDVSRRIAMQKALREELLEVRKQSHANIDALLKATEKLAEVQASIEAAEGDLAMFRNRVAMDELSVGLTADRPNFQDDRHPVADALNSFVSNLEAGLGALLQFLALAAPWLLLVVALPFIWRGMRRIWKLGRRG